MTTRSNRVIHPFTGQSVSGLLEARAALSADTTFLKWAPFEGAPRDWTYGAFAVDVARVAGGLVQRGVREGDRVIVLLENCPELLLVWFACAWLGAVCVPVNAAASAQELRYFSDRADAVGIVTQPKLLPVVSASGARAKWVVVTETDCGAAPERAPDCEIAFGSLFAEPVARRPVDSSAPVSVLFTSGTTARPKGVVWTHANALWGAKMSAMQEGLRADDVHLVFLPLFHVVAHTWSVLPTLWVGGTAVLQPKFSAGRFWDTAVRYRCTWASMVPFCTAVLAKQPVPETHHFRLWGHAFYSPSYEALFRVKLMGWWGMTEIITQGLVGDPNLPQTPKTIGRPSVGYGAAIVDENGRPVPIDEPGELRIKGTQGVSLFLEYLGDPDATQAAFDEHGYFRTGDRVIPRDDGSIQFLDRIKDVIKVGGENVAALEVERVISNVEGVREVAVVAKADPVLGEVPVGFITIDPQCQAARLVEAVLAACQSELAKFKVPREIRVIDEFPRVAIGKVAKAELRRRLA